MQKKIIVLAIASAMGSLAAGSAFADNATIYGRVDYGYESRSGTSGASKLAPSKQEFASGLEAGSRIGLKGNEDLGGGNKAIFEVEFGIAMDAPSLNSTGVANPNQASAAYFTNRHSYVGMTGDWGTAVGGRLDGVRYGIYQKYDAFGAGGMGNITQLTTQYDRADNAIAYISPNFADGFTVTAAYSSNTGGLEGNVAFTPTGGVAAPKNFAAGVNGNNGDDVLETIMLSYDKGPIAANLDYETTTQKGYSNATLRTYVIGGSYDFDIVKVGLMYDSLKGDGCSNIGGGWAAGACVNGTPADVSASVVGGNYDKSLWMISAKAPLGAFVLKASYGKLNDKSTALGTNASVTDAGASKFGLGVDYNLSKRTNFYADYGKINNDAKAKYTINAAANGQGSGYGVTGIEVGIAHKF